MTRLGLADAVLRGAAGCWLFATVIGQWLFAYYIVAVFGRPTVSGHFEDWTKRATLFIGYVPNDPLGNLAFAAHVLFGVVVAFGGVVQLIPQIRDRAIAVHRWNGRAFLVAAAVIGGGGLYMVWVRHASFHLVNSIAVSLDAVLILGFVVLAWRTARMRDLAGHRRWALRVFIVTNGAGFFIRVATAGWAVFAPGVGIRENARGQMDYFFELASYLLPLVVLELYLRARASASALARLATAVVVVVLTAYMIAGTLAAVMMRRHLVG